ncbi:DWNN-domain-containing protein [Choiromyces venosus 120613-1]|uniref:DWNN-domain-containing protein n=1 Tax=Choiromyces venosus 120613-1 TaxID=1336337 RepID=A0A3N4K0J9_9PEZI|nr:DWNN-domain-containing protein [Choiromyces venosus 120613-1]
MSSSVFFRFKSHKESTRVTFDGTGISVFELKRQIIVLNRLGDGTDFDFSIYNADTNEEYDDDTTIIPRSTSIIAARLPPSKPGRGTAQRYVSGKAPVNALPNAGRREKNFGNGTSVVKKNGSPQPASSVPALTGGESEEEKIAAMFQASSEQWNKTQEQMANATPIHRGGQGFKKNNAPAPGHPPPNGYICYRCGEKGHWIQQCPTNADPTFDGRPRVKRTTGIPRSFLKTVEKPLPPSADDDNTTAHSNPTSVMVNADGEYVVAQPDQASWESYQKKAATNTKIAAPVGSKELQDKGIECLICHKLMRDASKTPCCGKVYCEDCIHTTLLETDFVCPNCDAKEILLDAIMPDEDFRKKVEEYLKEKDAKEKDLKEREKSKSPSVSSSAGKAKEPSASQHGDGTPSAAPSHGRAPASAHGSMAGNFVPNPRKRQADEEFEPRIPRGPAAMRNNNPQFQQPPPHPMQPIQQQGSGFNNGRMFNPQQTFHHQFPGQNTHQATPPPHQFQPFNNQYPSGMNGMDNMNGMSGNYYQNGHYVPQGMMGGMGMNGMMGGGMGGGIGGMAPHNPYHMGMNGSGGNGMTAMNVSNGHGGNPMITPPFAQQFHHHQQQQHPQSDPRAAKFGYFPNQQKTVFSEPFPSEEDSPYMRKPVNPHRHSRPKRIRPSDFKALGE